MRTRTAAGLTLVVVLTTLAAIAVVAQTASAVLITVDTETNGFVYFTGDQDEGEHVLSISKGSVFCKEAHFLGSSFVTTTIVTEAAIFPSYPTEKKAGGSNCSAFGFPEAHVKVNECKYTFTTPTALGEGKVTWAATTQLHLTCPTGKAIEITPTMLGVSACTESLFAQTSTGGHITGKNAGKAGSEMSVTLEIAISSIHYTGTGGACGSSETHGDATLNGKSAVKCYSDAARTAPVGCTFS